MNCLEFRRAVGADPSRLTADAVAHRDGCVTCAKYAQEMQRLDGLIKRALKLPVPDGRTFEVPKSNGAPRRPWYAMAASVLLVAGLGVVVTWFGGTSQSALATEIVAHMSHEPEAMTATEARVSAELLQGTLAAKGLRLVAPLPEVSFAQNCWVRKTFAPHLVVQSSQGPVAVIVMPAERVSEKESFEEGPYHGQILPMGKGSLIVVAHDEDIVDEVAAKVSAAIAWL